MNREEMDALYDRVNDLSDLVQGAILAELFGSLKYFAKSGEEWAENILKDIERSVSRYEKAKK